MSQKPNISFLYVSATIIDRMNQKIWVITIPILSILITSVILSPIANASSLNIYPPESKPYNLTYAEHSQNFWKWLLPQPANNSPMEDPTGEKCLNGQGNSTSPIFYLSHNSGGRSERTCEVPAGKGLLIPVMEVELSDKDIPGASVEELKSGAKKDQDSVNSLYLKIDDKEYTYQDLLKYRTATDAFQVVFPDNGIYGVIKGGPATAVSDGFYILTEPITEGNHTIHFKSSLICLDPDCSEPNFVQDVKYNIVAR
jgi:hypothetical protein